MLKSTEEMGASTSNKKQTYFLKAGMWLGI